MTRSRMMTLKHYLARRGNNISLHEIARMFLGRPYSWKAKSLIRKVDLDGDFAVFHFKGLADPLYFPKDFGVNALYQVVVESFFSDNWHYYESNGTQVEKGDVVVDCGAAEGLFSLKVARRCAKLFLIEPNPFFLAALRRTFYGFHNVEIIPKAVSDFTGQASLEGNGLESQVQTGTKGVQIAVDTLDNLLYGRGIQVSYIKADLEGSDLRALRGARALIEKYLPKIAITTYHESSHARLMSSFLREISPEYRITLKGIYSIDGSPILLHAFHSR